jgi:hypothetical protein
MAFINSIGAGMFSDLSVANPVAPPAFATLDTQAEYDALFVTEVLSSAGTVGSAGAFVRMSNVREFPDMGTPPNIVNVPTYGQKTSQQIQGQSDAPSMEVTINYVASDWAKNSFLGNAVGNGKQYVFRFSMLNVEPTGTAAGKYASLAAGLGTVENAVWYWYGKIEAQVVKPNLTDSNQTTVTLSIQSPFYGAYTINA